MAKPITTRLTLREADLIVRLCEQVCISGDDTALIKRCAKLAVRLSKEADTAFVPIAALSWSCVTP